MEISRSTSKGWIADNCRGLASTAARPIGGAMITPTLSVMFWS